MRASCADLTLGQCLHAYLTSVAAAAVVAAAAAAAAAAAEAGAAAASSSSAISWSPPAAAAPAAGTGCLSNCSHTQAIILTRDGSYGLLRRPIRINTLLIRHTRIIRKRIFAILGGVFAILGGPGLAPTTLQPPRIVPPASRTL